MDWWRRGWRDAEGLPSTLIGRPLSCRTRMPAAYPPSDAGGGEHAASGGDRVVGGRTGGISTPSGAPWSQPSGRPAPCLPPSASARRAVARDRQAPPASCGNSADARATMPGRAPADPDRAIAGSSVAYRAIRQIAAADMRIARSSAAGDGVSGVRCQSVLKIAFSRPQVRSGIAMAIQAEPHRQRAGFLGQCHVLQCCRGSSGSRRPSRCGSCD